jgi:hypothetical protein
VSRAPASGPGKEGKSRRVSKLRKEGMKECEKLPFFFVLLVFRCLRPYADALSRTRLQV